MSYIFSFAYYFCINKHKSKMATKQSNVIITANGKQAENVIAAIQKRLDELKISEKQLNDTLEDMRKKGDANTKEYKQLEKALRDTKREIKSLDSAIEKDVSNMELVDKAIKNIATHTNSQLRIALRAGKKELEGMSATNKDLEPLRTKLKLIQDQINKNTGAVKKHSAAWQIAVKNITAYVGVFGAFNFLKTKLEDITRLSLKFSDQLADVRKVSGLEIEDINQLAKNLSKIDTRTSLSTMVGNLAYSGAKLGFGEKGGIQALESYVKAANQVNVALGEELGEEAMPALSKMTENLGLIDKYGVEDAMLKTASAMFKLSSTTTASAGPIVEFSKRILSLGKNAGLTAPQILALASASDSFMLMPEVASTAMGKLLVAMQRNHNLIESSLGITKGSINELYQQGKMMDALLLVFGKMREKGSSINQLGGLMKIMGGDGQRLVNVLVTMAEQLPTLEKHLKTANDAFREGIAVTAEYNIQQETAAGIMERANNLWEKAFVNPESVDLVKGLAQAWYDLSKELTQSGGYITSIRASMELLYKTMSLLIRLAPAGIFAVLLRGALLAGSHLASFGKYLISILPIIRGNKAAVDSLTLSWMKLSKATKYNIASLAIGLALEGIIYLTDKLSESTENAAHSQDTFNKSLTELDEQTGLAERELRNLRDAINEAGTETERRNSLISEFNNKYGQYLGNMLSEESSAYAVAKAYEEVCKQLRAKMALELRDKEREKFLKPLVNQSIFNRSDYDNIVKGSDFAMYGREWLQGFADDVRKELKRIPEPGEIKNTGAYIDNILKETYKLSDEQLKRIKANVNQKELPKLQVGETSKNPFNRKFWTGGIDVANNSIAEQAAHAAYRFISSEIRADDIEEQINDKYKEELETMQKANAQKEYRSPLENEAPDKAAIAAARKAELAQKKEWRQQLQESEAEAKAIVDNIKNFYQRQITETLNIATQTGMNEEIQDQLVRDLTMRMNTALANARKGIVGAKNDWEEFKKTLQADMIEPLVDGTNESMELLDRIENNNLAALRKKIELLSRSLNKPESALLDQVWKNATLNEKANAQIENKEEQRRRQAILDRNYTEKVNVDTQTTMEQFGFAMLTPQQIETIRKGGDDAKRFLDERTKEWQAILENARNNFAQVAATSPDNREDLFSILFGQDWQSHQDETTLRGLLDLTGEDFKLFYDELIKYNDAYVEARKKAAEQVVKVNDYVFENSHYVKQTNEEIRNLEQFSQQQQREGGMPRDMMQRMGMADTMANDPELLRLAILEEKERKHFDMMRELYQQGKIDYEQYSKALEGYDNARAAHADKVAQEVRERIEQLHNMVAPVEDFGWAVGEAFATMTRDAEEGRLALQDAARQMVEQFGKMTIKIYAELMTQKVQKALFNREMEAEDERHAIAETRTTEQGENKKVSVVKSIGALLFGTKKKQAKQEEQIERKSQKDQNDVLQDGEESKLDVVSAIETGMTAIKQTEAQKVSDIATESAAQDATVTAQETTGKVNAGIASGAANIIGKLGWWGIPLVAVITALLNGLLAFALSKLFGGSKKSEEGASVNTKLASGMLTYDKGNVQQAIGNAKRKNDERAEILTAPTVTVVQGEPSIVAEKGPELVVGRRTTQRLMRERPDIVSDIIALDQGKPQPTMQEIDRLPFASLTKDVMNRLLKDTKNGKQTNTHLPVPMKMFDAGNVRKVINVGPELVAGRETMQTTMLSRTNILQTITESNRNMATRNFANPNSQDAQSNYQDAAALQQQVMTNEELVNTLRVLTPAVMALQMQLQKPIKAEINKYGRGGLIDEVKSGMKFSEKYGL